MKVADLDRARALVADLAAARRLAERFAAGEPLRLTIGEPPQASSVSLSADYEAHIRRDVTKALELRQSSLRDALNSMGIETD